MEIGFQPGDLLIPREQDVDLTKWSVVACDQFTSQPEYWQEADRLVGDAPSALRLTLPEVYLDQPGVEARIEAINSTMDQYLAQALFREYPGRYLYLERTLGDGLVRKGLVGAVDLEAYDYTPGSKSLVRATEGTVLSRIPPRVKVREGASLELPHVMLLIDDPDRTVIEPLSAQKPALEPVYDFPLMLGGGHSRGWLVDKAAGGQVEAALSRLADPAAAAKKYGAPDKGVLLFAVGDGNHSLATAKECFRRLKEQLPPDQWQNHPARYALVEVVNIHDPALGFEPVHRVLFGVDKADLLANLEACCGLAQAHTQGAQRVRLVTAAGEEELWLARPTSQLPVGTLQHFLDSYLQEKGGRIDYVHGDDVAARLGAQPGNAAFLLTVLAKEELFPTVLLDGALPRKTFSMGHANDKRYYLEARKIR